MKLLKIGRDASNDIVLHSDKASSLHAEITLMDSGDIVLEDKGSHNGTFIQNKPISPGVPVNIRRGDAIRFADVELIWSQVPQPEDNSAYKAIYGIGSHLNNDIQVSGDTVSRYHATIKVGKDNKVYIVDHSKNGTTVDGQKIPSNTPIRIKKSSAIVCGRVPVNLQNAHIQWPANLGKTFFIAAASILVLIGIGFGAYKMINTSGKASLKALQDATAQVRGQFYIDVTIDDDPFVGHINGWPDKWEFGLDAGTGNLALRTLNESRNIVPIPYSGTAFFISEKGELGTNRHIACPWDDSYITPQQKDIINQTLEIILTNEQSKLYQLLLQILQSQITNTAELIDAKARLTRLAKAKYTISGRFEFLGVALAGTNVSSIADIHACQVIAESKDERKDVALLRLNSKKTPSEIISNGFYDIENARLDETSLRPQEDELTIIGYPEEKGTGIKLVSDGKEILPVVHRSYISKSPDDDMFQLQSNVVGGQSGSPIIDKDHRLVGVVWGAIRTTDVAYGCNIKHLKELYDRNKVRE